MLIIYLIARCSIAHAAAYPDIAAGQPIPAPVPLNQYSDKSIYYETQANGSAVARVGYPPNLKFLEGVPDVVATNISATSANPDGFKAVVNASGAAELTSATELRVAAPAGSVPSAAVATAASTMAGAGAPAAVLTKTVPLGGGAGSLASTIGKNMLGVGAAGAAFLGSPALLGGLMALQVGMAGYDFYQAMKGQGVSFAADGSALSASNYYADTYYFGPFQYAYNSGASPSAACQGYSTSGWGASSPWYVTNNGNPGSWICHFGAGAASSGFLNRSGTGTAFSSGTLLTNQGMQDALDKTTLDAHIAADLAAVAISRGFPLPIPNGYPALSSAAVSAKSNFSEASSSVDALGNKSSVLTRNVIDVSPSVNGAAPALDMRRETVTVVNAAPQSVASQSLAPTIANNLATTAAAATSQVTKDLCADHPSITACSDMSNAADVVDSPLKTKDINLVMTPVSVGTGLAVCPPPLVLFVPIINRSVTLDGSKWLCSAASLMKPLNVSLAWLSAGFIIMGGIRKNA